MDEQRKLEIAADIVASFVSNNTLPSSELPDFIARVYETLGSLGKPTEERAVPLTPAVPVKKSVTPDYLISLEDGKQYKTLKRHIARLGMTPDEYRSKWDLPRDYPMTAATYSERRSELAKTLGLGRKRQSGNDLSPWAALPEAEEGAAPQGEPEPKVDAAAQDARGLAPKKRGRPKKKEGDSAQTQEPIASKKRGRPKNNRA